MSYQKLSPEKGKVIKISEIKGEDLIGIKLKSVPHSHFPFVYTLPMMDMKEINKGTAILPSVPAYSSDDLNSLLELKNNSSLRLKYNIKDEWVLFFFYFISILI